VAIRLYWCPLTRAVRALWLLEEIGAKYEIVRVDVRAGQQNDPAFRAISPLGKVPALVDGEPRPESGDLRVSEIASRCKLAPALSAARAVLRWLPSRRAASSPRSPIACQREDRFHLSAGSFDRSRECATACAGRGYSATRSVPRTCWSARVCSGV
jgi:hypothetical protein